MAKDAAEKIIELNGGTACKCGICCWRWRKDGKLYRKVAEHLGIMAERVAVRGEEVLGSISFDIDGFRRRIHYM